MIAADYYFCLMCGMQVDPIYQDECPSCLNRKFEGPFRKEVQGERRADSKSPRVDPES